MISFWCESVSLVIVSFLRLVVDEPDVERKAIKGQKAKQPYAIGMKDDSPFDIGGLWENWKDPASDEWIRILCDYHHGRERAGGEIRDRMPLILAPGDYVRWLSDEPNPSAVSAARSIMILGQS
jgi:putative SOS response-associated peptidase YedK